jgi:hypothetical protein
MAVISIIVDPYLEFHVELIISRVDDPLVFS